MESKSSMVQASFYCNRCDKWVDGIEEEQGPKAPPGYRQALCDDCGSIVMYRLPGFWQRLQQKTSEFFDGVLSSLKK
jgi:DNA-directed RNA polymerase subunit RPC12/RpoP